MPDKLLISNITDVLYITVESAGVLTITNNDEVVVRHDAASSASISSENTHCPTGSVNDYDPGDLAAIFISA